MTQEAKIFIGIGIVALLLFFGAAFMLGDSSKDPAKDSAVADTNMLVRSDSHTIATSSAKVTVVEFGDFQCPACAAAHPTTKALLATYPEDVNFVFRNFPLPMHRNAQVAAEAAEAASEQGKYWEMHDMLYENQAAWEESTAPLDIFSEYAKSLELNVDAFRASVQGKKAEKKIKQDSDDGITLGVNSTPTFYINGEKLQSNTLPTIEDFKAKIDPLLQK